LPGKRHSKETKALALAAKDLGSSNREAGRIAGVPESTVREWIAHFRTCDDSELEAFIAQEKRVINATWVVLGSKAQSLALDLCEQGEAKAMLAATTAAGIASTKLEPLGQPRNVTPQTASGPVFTTPFNPTTPVEAKETAKDAKEEQES
jgi:hypothetical protein